MTIAVDFDGTIVDHRYPQIGKEKPFAFDVLRKLQKDGHKLILWTAREGKLLDDAVMFCKENGIDFYAVNSDGPAITNYESAGITRKLRVDLFIDDRSLGGLPDWPTIYRMIKHKMSWTELFTDGGNGEYDDDEPGLFGRLIGRCRRSRSKLNHKSGRGHRGHHW